MIFLNTFRQTHWLTYFSIIFYRFRPSEYINEKFIDVGIQMLIFSNKFCPVESVDQNYK